DDLTRALQREILEDGGDVDVHAVHAAFARELRTGRTPQARGGPFVGGGVSAACDLILFQEASEIRQDSAGMHGKGANAMRLTVSVQSDGKERVRRLRLAVRSPFVVSVSFEIGVVEVHAAETNACGRHRNDSC